MGVKGNIEERDIFDEKLSESSLELRLKSALEGERVIGESPYRIEDYDEADWADGWNLLKNEGIWDVEYFGDLMIIALAHYIHKNILLINSDPNSPNITVILGDQFGSKLDSDAPVILAYSGTHYESLLPCTEEDKVKSSLIEVVKESPNIHIDNWEHHNDDNNTITLTNNIEQLTLRPKQPESQHQRSPVPGDNITGIDNWKHCYPGRGTHFATTSQSWGEEREATPIPIMRVKQTSKVINIPITRVNF